jgi:hypothetical protein
MGTQCAEICTDVRNIPSPQLIQAPVEHMGQVRQGTIQNLNIPL